MSETPAPVSPAETQVNAISTIAAAAFGIAVGGTASAADGKAGARTALNETR